MIRLAMAILALAGAILSGAIGGRAVQAAPLRAERPNVVLILVDDLGYNDVGFQGATDIRTPNIDRIAREGVVFTNGYVASAVCAASRAGLLTGRYPARFGMDGNIPYAPFDSHIGLPVRQTTFARRLQAAGYRTGLVGKWHLGAAPRFLPRNRGFDYFFGFVGGGHTYWGRDVDAANLTNWARTPIIDNAAAAVLQDDDYLTDVLTDRAIGFIQAKSKAPFFLYLSYNAPHTPLQAPHKLIRKYAHIPRDKRRRYLAMVDSLDANVGRLLDALEKSGRRDNTVLFFLSDNGGFRDFGRKNPGWADNRPLRGGKTAHYEGGIRVPFVASWPRAWPQGETYEPMVISLDIASTVMALAGRPIRLDGVNLDPYLRGAAAGPPHKALFWRHGVRYAVRAGDLKLIRGKTVGPTELFNLREDVGETRDLMGADPEAGRRLVRLWNEWNQKNAPDPIFLGTWHYSVRRHRFMVESHRFATYGKGAQPLKWRLRGVEAPPSPPLLRPPPPPLNLKGSGYVGGILLEWDHSADAAGYEFRLKSSRETAWRPWKHARVVKAWRSECPLPGLTRNLLYYVQLRAKNAAGKGRPSPVLVVKTK